MGAVSDVSNWNWPLGKGGRVGVAERRGGPSQWPVGSGFNCPIGRADGFWGLIGEERIELNWVGFCDEFWGGVGCCF